MYLVAESADFSVFLYLGLFAMVRVTSSAGDAKVYHLSAGRSRAADLLPRKKRRRQRGGKGAGDAQETNEVELLQDFEFNISSQCLKVSADGEYVAATGIYPPEVHSAALLLFCLPLRCFGNSRPASWAERAADRRAVRYGSSGGAYITCHPSRPFQLGTC